MITLFKVEKHGKYLVSCPDYGVYEMGDLMSAKGALEFCGVDKEEIESALKEMSDKGHSKVEFGINKTWLFTSQVDFQEVA